MDLANDFSELGCDKCHCMILLHVLTSGGAFKVARRIKVLDAFVASPGDVESERLKLEEVIEEINLAWGKSMKARIELRKWETHAIPGVGNYPQEVINRSIGEQYDIFIGIMWARFGTPTPMAGSGTEEEFNRAIARVDKGEKVAVMIYFKDEPIEPSNCIPEQLQKVQVFKKSLGEKGVLYHTFRSTEDFARILRIHLPTHVQDAVLKRTRKKRPPDIKHKKGAQTPKKQLEEGDLGILELQLSFQTRANQAAISIRKISEASNQLTANISARTAALIKVVNETGSLDSSIGIVNSAAGDLDLYSMRIELETPVLNESLRLAFISAGKLLLERPKVVTVAPTIIQGEKKSIQELISVLQNSIDAIEGFRVSTYQMPPLTSQMIKAKHRVDLAINGILQVTRQAIADANAVLKIITKE